MYVIILSTRFQIPVLKKVYYKTPLNKKESVFQNIKNINLNFYKQIMIIVDN